MTGRHRAAPRRLWLSIIGVVAVVLGTIVAVGYASSPSSGGFSGFTVPVPATTTTLPRVAPPPITVAPVAPVAPSTATSTTTAAPAARRPATTQAPDPWIAGQEQDAAASAGNGPHVTPGAYCSTLGEAGITPAGSVDHCKPSATDSRLRWRA